MRAKVFGLLAVALAGILGFAHDARADNNATGSTGTVQVGNTSVSPAASASSPAAGVTVSAPASVSGSGGNNASNSTGAVQVGGGNNASGSTGAVQAGGAGVAPSASAGAQGASAGVSAPVTVGGNGGGNSASVSTGAAQVGGGNSASGSTGAAQVSGAQAGLAIGASAAGSSAVAALGLGNGAGSAGTAPAGAAFVPATTPTGNRTVEQAPGGPTTRRTLAANRVPEGAGVIGQLPFTGLVLGLIVLVGAVLLLLGLALRRYASLSRTSLPDASTTRLKWVSRIPGPPLPRMTLLFRERVPVPPS